MGPLQQFLIFTNLSASATVGVCGPHVGNHWSRSTVACNTGLAWTKRSASWLTPGPPCASEVTSPHSPVCSRCCIHASLWLSLNPANEGFALLLFPRLESLPPALHVARLLLRHRLPQGLSQPSCRAALLRALPLHFLWFYFLHAFLSYDVNGLFLYVFLDCFTCYTVSLIRKGKFCAMPGM